MSTEQHVVCEGCKRETDPEHCWCGSPMKDHGYFDGHGAIPMGCECGREPPVEESEFEYEEKQIRYGKLPPP